MDPRNPRPVNGSANPKVVRETRLNMGRPLLLETFWQDLRFGARALFRSPGFAAIAVLTLALGIGANAAIFSVVNTVLLRPLPWSEPDRAVMIWSKWTAFDKTWVAAGEVVDYRKRATTFARSAPGATGRSISPAIGNPSACRRPASRPNLFSTLGVGADDRPNVHRAGGRAQRPKVVVLGYALW